MPRDWPGIELYNEGPKLGIGPGSMFRARDQLRIKILGLNPSLVDSYSWIIIIIISWKMSECLRTYGPQIIRVPQLQIEDWAWLVVPSYKLQN